MKMTEDALALIRQFEGFRGRAYLCPSGVWTIGYGHTSHAGPPAVTRGKDITESEAETLLRSDVENFAKDVTKLLFRELNDKQFSALVSFAYNIGIGALRTSSVLKAINAGDFDAVPRRLQLWVKAGGRILPGLVKRRAAEAAMFMGGTDGASRSDTGIPSRVDGKPARESTTVISAIITAIAALLSGGLGVSGGTRVMALPLAALGIAAALWIIRERLLKSKEEGI